MHGNCTTMQSIYNSIFISLQAISIHSKTRKKIKNRIKSHDWILPITRGCHRKGEFPSGKERRTPRGKRWLSYTLHRWGPWGPITGATSSLAILPQIATLKRGTAPKLPAVARATEPADCSVHRLRLGFTTESPPPFPSPSLSISSTHTVRLSAACNTVIGQFRGFSSE